jgi:hypothetical protein
MVRQRVAGAVFCTIVVAGCVPGTGDAPAVAGCEPEVPEVAVQLIAPDVAGPDGTGFCTITGTIGQSFRGGVAPGDTLVATLPCMTGASAAAQGYLPFDPAPLRGAAVIEVQTNGPFRDVAAGQAGYAAVPLAALTAAPVWSDYVLICS